MERQRARPVALHIRAEYKLGRLTNELRRRCRASEGLSIKRNPPLKPDGLCLPELVRAFAVVGGFVCLIVPTALRRNVLFADALCVHVFVSVAD